MNSSSNAGELERIETKVRSLLGAYLNSNRPYLLSKLGKDLGEDLRIMKVVSDKTLSQFLIERFSNEYTIVLTGVHSNVQAVVRSVGMTESFSGTEQDQSQQRIPRYNYRFWAAFSVPLGRGRRFLNLRDFTFEDSDQEPSGDYLEVEPHFIVSADAGDRDALIRDEIERWLAHHKLPPDQFIAKPHKSTEGGLNIAGGRSLLAAMIEALDRRQLANTNLSLDVVADLLRRRV